MDGDLGGPLRETLPGAQVEGDTRPTPVVNLQAGGDERLGLARGVNCWLTAIARRFGGANPAWAVLAANHRLINLLNGDWPNGAEHLHLLVAKRIGLEVCRRLHGHERE